MGKYARELCFPIALQTSPVHKTPTITNEDS